MKIELPEDVVRRIRNATWDDGDIAVIATACDAVDANPQPADPAGLLQLDVPFDIEPQPADPLPIACANCKTGHPRWHLVRGPQGYLRCHECHDKAVERQPADPPDNAPAIGSKWVTPYSDTISVDPTECVGRRFDGQWFYEFRDADGKPGYDDEEAFLKNYRPFVEPVVPPQPPADRPTDARAMWSDINKPRTDLMDELERLRRWKKEATTVISQWEDVWTRLGMPGKLGESKALAATTEITRLRAALMEAQARNERLHPDTRMLLDALPDLILPDGWSAVMNETANLHLTGPRPGRDVGFVWISRRTHTKGPWAYTDDDGYSTRTLWAATAQEAVDGVTGRATVPSTEEGEQ